jgi:hypothetical protein
MEQVDAVLQRLLVLSVSCASHDTPELGGRHRLRTMLKMPRPAFFTRDAARPSTESGWATKIDEEHAMETRPWTEEEATHR